jgi:hypothetical protein
MIECTWVRPVTETRWVMIRTSSTGENYAENDNAQNDHNLDAAHPKLQFAKELNTKEVDDDNHHQEYGNPYSGINSLSGNPIFQHKGNTRQLCWNNQQVLEPIAIEKRVRKLFTRSRVD